MKRIIAALLIVVSISFVTHSSVLNNGILDEWDDHKYVLTPEAQGGLAPENIKRIFSGEMVKKHYYFHPLTKLSFALEHQFFQINPRVYHLNNLLLHLVNTALVFWVVSLLSAQLVLAFLTSLLFGIHPLQVETVAWISTRKELLFTCFYLCALIAYIYYCIRSRDRTKYILLSFFFFACSLLSKPSAVTLPFALLILDLYFNRGFKRSVLTEKLPFFALSLFIASFYYITSRSWESTIYTSDYFSSLEKIAICLSTSAMYFYKLIAPLELSFVYLPPQKVEGILPLKYFLMAGFPLLALIILWKWARNRKVILTGGLFFFATIFLSGSGKTFMGDHYVYLPSLGFFLMLAAFLHEILNYRLVGSWAKGAVVLILVIYLGFLSTTSHARGKVWLDSMTLFNDALQKSPTQPVALLNRGILYGNNGQFEEAIDDLSGAIDGGNLELSGAEASIVATRAMFYAQSGRPQEAAKDLTRVIEIGDPAFASKAYNERGLIADSLGDIKGALADFNAAITLDPSNEFARSNKDNVMRLAQASSDGLLGPKGESFYSPPQNARILSGNDGRCDPSTGENCDESEAFREALDKKYWQQEILAQEYELIFIKLWDDMRVATQKLGYLKDFPFESITIPLTRTQRQLDLGVVSAEYTADPKTYSKEEFVAYLQRMEQEGYRIEQLEFHHGEFRYPSPEEASSVISFVWHLVNDKTGKKIIYKGQIEVAWDTQKDEAWHFMPKTIKVIKLVSLEREVRDSSFVQFFTVGPDQNISGNSPVILYDLDRNGFSEIILPALNMVVRNKGDGSIVNEDLFESPLTNVSSAFVGELTGDDEADLIVTLISGQPLLYKGKKGVFDQTPVVIDSVKVSEDFRGSFNAITAGDIDQDGDLDLFFGQYKTPFMPGESLPYPYYDANDGEPAYLLQNDGQGNFKDITVEAGLGKKRFRRTYSASFVDLDQDRDLDLLVVSDFSGVDVYSNDGMGNFKDVTDKAIDKRSSFGMSHTFGDFNLDGRMDIYVIGMGSTTARRLTKMDIKVEEFEKIQDMVMLMGYGNRMYYGTDEPGIFKSAPNNDQVARTGWGWGSTNFDVDNDGDPEIYVANGNESNATALDYCTFYWRNDIFMDKRPTDHSDLYDLFGRGGSWNGFEHNVLFLNDRGENFADIGYLLDVAFEFDTRSVISDDINLDGRADLIVKDKRGIVHVMLNGVKTDNHWVGVILQEKDHVSPLGATVTVATAEGKKQWQVVSGDSFLSQHPYKKVFGLNKETNIDYLEVQWLDGRTQRLDNPKADKYYKLHPSL